MIRLDGPLTWRQVAAVAAGEPLELAPAARARIITARTLVEAIVAGGIRAYGVNTGVGALCDVIVAPSQQRQLSRNIIMSHAVGVGPPLSSREARAIMVAAVNNFAHGHSGVRLDVVGALLALLNGDCVPEVPSGGSVGYLTHMAHIALVLLGEGHAVLRGARSAGGAALASLGLAPLTLEAKEGLSLVNGTPCSTGLAVIAVARTQRLLDWADMIGAMSFENLRGQIQAFDPQSMALRAAPGLNQVALNLRTALAGSPMLAASAGRTTQDAISLRAIPQVHGAARDAFDFAAGVVDRELAVVTDNPLVAGTVESPKVYSAAHAVGAAIGLTADSLATAVASVAAMSERRTDRLVNPLVSGLPAFLAAGGGVGTGLMIAQYTAASLVAENRRLAAPASLDGGITSGLQEDHLVHATPAVLKLLRILDNAEMILAIELLAATQAYDLQPAGTQPAAPTAAVRAAVRGVAEFYRDQRPLIDDMESVRGLLVQKLPRDL